MPARIVLITGAAGNLGRAVAEVFAGQGDTVVLLGRSRASLAQAFGAEDARRVFLPVDLLQQQALADAVQALATRLGSVDVLCNLAGHGINVNCFPA